MTSEEDEEDYMSDTFLKKSVKDDVKPGLISSYSEKRRIAAIERKKLHDELNRMKHPSIRVMEFNYREEGLNKALEKDNKGFALLQKMGYKPGTGIGKAEGTLKEPISVSIKNDRQGLGHENKTEKYRHYKRMQNSRATAVPSLSVNEYRARIVQNFSKRQLDKDLRDSQRACQNLDRKRGCTRPICSWYWLDDFDGNYEAEEDTVDQDDVDDIQPANHSDNDEDSDDDGDARRDTNYSDDVDDDDDEYCSYNKRRKNDENCNDRDTEDNANDIEEKLNTLTSYLRETYFYCVWCGIEFADDQDLQSSCPGNTSDLH